MATVRLAQKQFAADGYELNINWGAKTQRWFVYQKGNSYVLKSAGATVSVLDLTDKSAAKGTSVIQTTTDATNTQRFYINMV